MLDTSPLLKLPEAARSLWISAFNASQENGRDEVVSTQDAWTGVKRAFSLEDGGWVPRSELVPLDFYITKAAQDTATGQMRWMAVASDTSEDSLADEMSKELFEGFLRRIKSGEEVPERWQTDFWKGGKPYLSVSHYTGSQGTLPGEVEAVYLDGDRLKAKGTFADTLIGRAAFQSVRESVKKTKAKIRDFDPVRISIGFLDYKHEHKSNGALFVRKSMDDICIECVREKLRISEGKGLRYRDGPLIHLAMSRVPINERTSIEVNRAMPTMKEDAASIIGAENAEELDEIERELIAEAKKSRAFVTKSEAVGATTDVSTDSLSVAPTEAVTVTSGNVTEYIVAAPEVVTNTVATSGYVQIVPIVEKAEVVPAHVLDAVLSDLKAVFDGLDKSDPRNMKPLEGSLESIAETIRSQFGKGTPKSEASVDIGRLVEEAVTRALASPLAEIALLRAKLERPVPVASNVQTVIETAPAQRSISVPLLVNDPAQHKSKAVEKPKVSSLSAAINKSVGLPDDFERSGGTYLTG